jgi:hypothetical protein
MNVALADKILHPQYDSYDRASLFGTILVTLIVATESSAIYLNKDMK